MDSIKKKMIAMKMEKENAQDRAEQLEQQLRDTEEQKAKVRLIPEKPSNLVNDQQNQLLTVAICERCCKNMRRKLYFFSCISYNLFLKCAFFQPKFLEIRKNDII